MRLAVRYTGFILIALLIVAALLMGTLRMLMPMVGQYRAEIEQQLSTSLNLPLKIGELTGSWEGFHPQLYLKDVSLLNADKTQTLLHLDEAWVGINIPVSLLHGQVEGSRLKVSGTTLSILRGTDGVISLEGFGNEKSNFLDWLLGQRQLQLEKSHVAWTDQKLGRERVEFTVASLQLKNHHLGRHEINGAVSLGDSHQQSLAFNMDFRGDIKQPREWDGTFSTEGSAVQVGPWLSQLAIAGVNLKQGSADFKLSGAGKNAQLTGLEGEIRGRDLSLSGQADQTLAIKSAHGQLVWQRQAQGWELDVARFVMQRDTALSIPSQFKIVSTTISDHRLDASFNQVRLEDAVPLFLMSPNLPATSRDALSTAQPRGEMHDIHVRLQSEDTTLTPTNTKLTIEARLAGVTAQAWKKFPAVVNVSGMLHADPQAGMLDLASHTSKLDFPKIFSAPLDIASATGRLSWQKSAEGWQFAAKDIKLSNADVSTKFSGDLALPVDGSSPMLNLEAQFDNGDAAKIVRYLPINLVHENVIHWFETAVVNGHISSGSVSAHGHLKDLFVAGQSNFDAHFDVSDGVLNYHPDWPQVTQLEATVSFKGPNVEVQTTRGKIYDAELLETHASIADLSSHEAELSLQGKVRSSSADALRFIKESPLKNRFAGFIEDVTASGNSLVDLDLRVPLTKHDDQLRPVTVKGTVALSETNLRLANKAKVSGIELGGINGTLNFTEAGVTGDDITAKLFDEPVHLAIHSERDAEQGPVKGVAVIEARSTISIAELAKQLLKFQPDANPVLLDHLQGKADWAGTLRLAESPEGKSGGSLTVQSNLQGMSVDLPEPLKKSADEILPLVIQTNLTDEQNHRYMVSYGERVHSVFEVAQSDNNWEIQRGEVHLGKGNVALPAQGLRITGDLPHFSWDAWKGLLDGGKDTQPGLIQKFDGVDVRIGALQAFGQNFASMHMQANKKGQDWSVALDSEQLAGILHFPHAPEAAWAMEFERLHLAKSESDKKRDYDPRQWPALRITSKSFKYGDLDLGELALETSKQPNGLHIEQLKFISPTMGVNGQGDWEINSNQQTSRFEVKVHGEEIDKILETFGYSSNNIKGGATHIELAANWAGAPMDFALERLNGTLALDIEKGRFLDIEPGAGRIFGLLSLQALPRRFSLDFSDFFRKGFAFDHVTGEFNLKDGNAYTDNLIMLGPSAVIRVQGRTGLAAQDYDQIVTVKSHFGDSLALAAAVAGGPAGAGVGAVILLAQKLFESDNSNLKGPQYTVRGSWAAPVVEPVSDKKSAETSN